MLSVWLVTMKFYWHSFFMKRFIIFCIIIFSSMSNNFLHYYGDAFSNVKAKWVKRLQGMCHDEKFFYITQKDYIWKIPRNIPIEKVKKISSNLQSKIIKRAIPKHLRKLGSNHMGDCDVHNDLVYIALEGTKPQKMLLMKVDSLEFVAAPDLSNQQIKAPWVSIDPLDGTIYTSDFNINESVFKYRPKRNFKELELVGYFNLKDKNGKKIKLKRVQGGDIVLSRELIWFVSDTENGGLYAFDLNTGELIHHKRIPYDRDFPSFQELEGIDTLEEWETDFSLYKGNLFVPMLDHNLFRDKAFLKHYQY
jgi:hypothetical protein